MWLKLWVGLVLFALGMISPSEPFAFAAEPTELTIAEEEIFDRHVFFTPDGNAVGASLRLDGVLSIYQLGFPHNKLKLNVGKGSSRKIATLSSDGTLLMVFAPIGSNSFPEVSLWNLKTGKRVWKEGAKTRVIRGAAFAKDGSAFAFLEDSKGLLLRDLKTLKTLKTVQQEDSQQFVVSNSGKAFATLTNKKLQTWSSSDLAEIGSFEIPHDPMKDKLHIRVSDDGKKVGIEHGASIKVYDCSTGDLVWSLPATPKSERDHFERDFEFSPSDDLIALITTDNSIQIWDFANEKEVWKKETPLVALQPFGVAWSHTGKSLAVSRFNGISVYRFGDSLK